MSDDKFRDSLTALIQKEKAEDLIRTLYLGEGLLVEMNEKPGGQISKPSC